MINYHFPLIGGKLIEQKIAKWRAEGFVKGVAQKDAEWSDWNSRRMDAERDGVPFLEPPPGDVSRAGLSEKERE